MKCTYCGSENDEGELFCENCGRPLIKTTEKTEVHEKYVELEDGIIVYCGATQFECKRICEGFIEFPKTMTLINGKWEMRFSLPQGCSLKEYLTNDFNRTIENYIKIEQRLLDIFREVQSKNQIIGSCDLEDFYLVNNDPSSITLRIVRPLMMRGIIPNDYEIGEFAAPEVRNGDNELVNLKTDVYLAAIIFNRMIIGERYSTGNYDAQLFWGYTLTNGLFYESNKEIRRFHQWLGESLNMNSKKRALKDICASKELFCKSVMIEDALFEDSIIIDDSLETNVGKGKKALMRKAGKKEDEWNEDTIEKYERTVDGNVLKAYLLADGISNCDIGSGYIASNIIRKVFIETLDLYTCGSIDDDKSCVFEKMAIEIIQKSNRIIWEEACKSEKHSGSIMGSTFVFAVVYSGVMYSYCLGDSLLYLVRDGISIPLHCIDTAGIVSLQNGMSYSDYRQMEGRDSLALYVGGVYSRDGSDCCNKRKIEINHLKKGDIVLIASDGVCDYIGSKLYETDWDKEAALTKLLVKDKPLEEVAKDIINKDNKNGGGDNLSLILIRIGGMDNE